MLRHLFNALALMSDELLEAGVIVRLTERCVASGRTRQGLKSDQRVFSAALPTINTRTQLPASLF
jgi:hypothetical protein